MPVSIAHIYRYPVKGLSAEALDRVTLAPGRALPGDRRFALELADARIREPGQWRPRNNFLMLARNPRLAALETAFDPESGWLTVVRDGRIVAQGRMTEPQGRAVLEKFFAAYMGDEARGRPRLVEASEQPFTDAPAPFLSIINLASLGELARAVGAPVEPLRFRGNLYLDGAEPWAEFAWIGREIEAGTARLRVVEPIERCAATNANPETGVRDMNLPRALADAFGHVDMGVYAEVVGGGQVALGDPVREPL